MTRCPAKLVLLVIFSVCWAGAANAAKPVRLQPYTPLPQAHQEYIDQLLDYWEHSSGEIKQYRCTFTRWEHDTVFGPKQHPKTISTGVIRYKVPDKGLFEVQEIYDYKGPPQQPNGEAQFEPRATEDKEKWICDGQSVYEFDAARKRLIERPLPREMQGQAIVDGPVPFLFGAKAEKIKQRYWLQVITPSDKKQEYWLEAWPLRREDQVNFKKVEIIIDQRDFLPKAIQIYDPNYNPQKGNLSRTAFQFENRQVNFIDFADLDKLQLFHRAFHRPKKPRGWKTEVIPFQAPPSAPATPRSAQRNGNPPGGR